MYYDLRVVSKINLLFPKLLLVMVFNHSNGNITKTEAQKSCKICISVIPMLLQRQIHDNPQKFMGYYSPTDQLSRLYPGFEEKVLSVAKLNLRFSI